MREENTKERETLAALLLESKQLREQSAAGRKDLKEVRRQVMGQMKELVETLNHASRGNPQAAPDVRGDTSGLLAASAEHVLAAGKNGSVSSAVRLATDERR